MGKIKGHEFPRGLTPSTIKSIPSDPLGAVWDDKRNFLQILTFRVLCIWKAVSVFQNQEVEGNDRKILELPAEAWIGQKVDPGSSGSSVEIASPAK